jgi:hypothetical protein
MSLEEAIRENTAAVRELIAALSAFRVASPAPAGAPAAAEPTKPAAQTPGAEVTAPKAPVAEVPPDDGGGEDGVSYQEAASAVTALARAKGREAALAVLAKFGASNLKQVPESRYAAVINACEEAMGA